MTRRWGRTLNKRVPQGIGVLLLLVIVVSTIIVAVTHNDNKVITSAAKTKDTACKVLTFTAAHALLGDSARSYKVVFNGPAKDSTDLSLSTCAYKQTGSDASLSAELIARTPLTTDGAASNKKEFKDKTLGGLQKSPYGDAAFWNAGTGQLNILKGSTWYSLSFGPSEASARTLSQTETMADLLLPQFK